MDKKEHLNDLATKKRSRTKEKVEEAFIYLENHGHDINFNSVAKISGLSKTTLYNNPDIRARIESIRDIPSGKSIMAQNKLVRSEKNSKAIIESLKRKNLALQEENKKLREQLEMAYAEYYSKF